MSEYTKVVIEADDKGRLSIHALDDRDAGHGERLAGPKFNYDLMSGARLAKVLVRKELEERDVKALRSYLAIWDEIQAAKAVS